MEYSIDRVHVKLESEVDASRLKGKRTTFF